MSDQANTLRRLMQLRRKPEDEPHLPRSRQVPVITVASGKGGVGKSCLVANVAALLARSGSRILVIDGDIGLANLDIMMGVRPRATLEEVLAGEADLAEAILAIEPGLWLLPSGSGLMELRESSEHLRQRLIALLDTADFPVDAIMIDAGSGIHDNVLSLHHPTFESVVVLTPEPTSLADGYGLIKLLRRQCGIDRVSVIVNQVTGGRQGMETFRRLSKVAEQFIDTKLEYLGHCERDENFTQSVMKRKILLDLDQGTEAIPSLQLLAKRLRTKCLSDHDQELKKSSSAFWRTLLGASGVKA